MQYHPSDSCLDNYMYNWVWIFLSKTDWHNKLTPTTFSQLPYAGVTNKQRPPNGDLCPHFTSKLGTPIPKLLVKWGLGSPI